MYYVYVCLYATILNRISHRVINHCLCLTGEAHPQLVCKCLLTLAFIQRQTLGLSDGGCQAPWPRPLH